MSAEPILLSPARNTALDTTSFSSPSSSLPLWDRLTTWASENKAVVYTIAGVAVVVSGAGVIYYLSDSRKDIKSEGTEEKKRASKKERRKAKKEKDRAQAESREVTEKPGKKSSWSQSTRAHTVRTATSERAPTVESDPLEELPRIDESTVDSLSDQVSGSICRL